MTKLHHLIQRHRAFFRPCSLAALVILLLVASACDRQEEKPPMVDTPPAPAVAVMKAETTPIPTEPAPLPPEEPSEEVPIEEVPVEEVPVEYVLTYQAGKHGSIDGRQQQQVPHDGAGSQVKAVPAPGYHLTGWSDGVTAATRQERDVTAAMTVTAAFAPNQYQLLYEVEGEGRVIGDSRQTVTHGESGEEVEAVPAEDHHFVGWSDGVTPARRQEAQVRGDLAVRAVFAPNTYRIGGLVSGLVGGTELVLRNGDDELIITDDGPFFFAAEHPSGTPYQLTVLSQPTAPTQTCTINNDHGVVDRQEIADIEVVCTINTYHVGGRLTGLPPDREIILRHNEEDELVMAQDGDFVFPAPFEDGTAYRITLQGPAPGDNWRCELINGSGVLAGKEVNEVEVACAIIPVLQARIGRGDVELNWNREDFLGATFNLCRAETEMPPGDAVDCRELNAGLAQSTVTAPHRIAGLVNNTTYWFQLEVQPADGRPVYSDPISAAPFGGLNDSGIDWCADNMTNHGRDGSRPDRIAGCEQLSASHPGQDGHHGRDAAARQRQLTKTGSGSGGFDFTRVCASGEAAGKGQCPPNPALGDGPDNWACSRDNFTGLLWEIKSASGPRDTRHTYSWYQPENPENKDQAYSGLANGGHCSGSDCDAAAYVRLLNELALCGETQWRLPTRRELLSIVDNSRHDPAADTTFFPNTQANHYWTATSYADQPGSAWQVYFRYGETYPAAKSQDYHLRLVQGQTVTFGGAHPEFSAGGTGEFTYYDDGTVRHNITGLQWLRCSLGQTWDGGNCTGKATVFTWQEALQAAADFEFAGHRDWRLPNKNELEALAALDRTLPAIRDEAFPATPAVYFWSASPYAVLGKAAWSVDFGSGTVNASVKNGNLRVRLVRDNP